MLGGPQNLFCNRMCCSFDALGGLQWRTLPAPACALAHLPRSLPSPCPRLSPTACPQKYGTPVVKSGTDFREFTEIELTVGPAEVSPASAGAAGTAGAADAAVAADAQPCSPPATPRSLMLTAWQLPGRVADSVASLPDSMARLALRSHARCSKWAKLAGIPALAGCSLASGKDGGGGGDGNGNGSSCDSPAAEAPHCLHLQSPRGGGKTATPEGRSAALVYEEAAAASLATSLIGTRLAGVGSTDSSGSGISGSGGSVSPLLLTFHCLRHVITSELPEDPEVAEIVQVSSSSVRLVVALFCAGIDKWRPVCSLVAALGVWGPCEASTPIYHLMPTSPTCGAPLIAAVRQADGRAHGCGGGAQRHRPGWPLLHVSWGKVLALRGKGWLCCSYSATDLDGRFSA